jgi:acetyltransferase-like isoleucine patch superfamily enzyme
MSYIKHLQNFKTDPKAEIFFIFSSLCQQMIKLLSSLIMNIYYKAYGIKVGKRNKYIGLIKLKRFQNSSISIGDHCIFLSKPFSNQIGINRPCMLSTQSENAKIEIGNFCGLSGTVIGAFSTIRLGNNVRCGANTLITDSDWHDDDDRSGKVASVNIEDNVWLGVDVTILKGVTIGVNSVIGAGSVVTRSIPANVIAAGNPCKILKPINK